VQLSIRSWLNWETSGGINFHRYFTENDGRTVHGSNRINFAPGPFISTQLLLRF
jgi:hypothetical protein